MSDAGEADRTFVTFWSKVVADPEFARLVPWWRRRVLEQALDGADLAAFKGLALELDVVKRLVFALEAEVASKQELIDGRTRKQNAGPAAPAASIKRSRR